MDPINGLNGFDREPLVVASPLLEKKRENGRGDRQLLITHEVMIYMYNHTCCMQLVALMTCLSCDMSVT